MPTFHICLTTYLDPPVVHLLLPAQEQCEQIWRNFTTLSKFYIPLAILELVHLEFGKNVMLLDYF